MTTGRPVSQRATRRLNTPPFAILMLDVLLSLGTVEGATLGWIPLQLFAGTKRDVAQQGGFGERPGVSKVARSLTDILAGFSPVFVMAA